MLKNFISMKLKIVTIVVPQYYFWQWESCSYNEPQVQHSWIGKVFYIVFYIFEVVR